MPTGGFALPEISGFAWCALAAGAFLVGLSKTALPGANTISVALFAAALPAKTSTGALLLLLLAGDALALIAWRRHADWQALLWMLPAVVLGLAAGALFLAMAGDDEVRRLIGVLVLLLTGVAVWRRRRPAAVAPPSPDGDDAPGQGPRATRVGRAAWGYGSLGGFTTMVANAGGPVMSLYLLSTRLPVAAFLGTSAWFFAIMNVMKLPVSVSLGLITPAVVRVDALLLPALLVGGLVGWWAIGRIPQRLFENAVLGMTAAGGVYLLF